MYIFKVYPRKKILKQREKIGGKEEEGGFTGLPNNNLRNNKINNN